MKTELERQAREAEQEPAVATPTRPEPLVLALQRGAGNQAVGRMIARLVKDKPRAHPTLQLGSRNPEVTRLQTRLNVDGAEPALEVSGVFDAPTKAAVIAFQGRHGLKTDGIVGIRTWGMVDELERRGLDGPQVTDLESTQPVTQEDHDAVEQILHPGHSGGGVTGPPMTDHEVGGKYETEVIAALDPLYTDTVSALVKTPAVDMNHANRVSAAAQEEVEKFFGASITMASRKPTGEWHPGSSAMGLADASKRPMSQGDILGWTDYFMDNGSYAPAQIAAGLHYDGTRLDSRPQGPRPRPRPVAEQARRQAQGERDGARWPAEASTGTVFLQLRDAGYQNKVGMWDLFMTLVHEFMHLVTHPNYGNAADLIGGGGRDILIEGMDEHMSQQVWPAVRDRAFGTSRCARSSRARSSTTPRRRRRTTRTAPRSTSGSRATSTTRWATRTRSPPASARPTCARRTSWATSRRSGSAPAARARRRSAPSGPGPRAAAARRTNTSSRPPARPCSRCSTARTGTTSRPRAAR